LQPGTLRSHLIVDLDVEAMADVERLETHAATEDCREAVVAKAVAEELQELEAAHLPDLRGFAVADAGPPVEAVFVQPEALQERAGLGRCVAGLSEAEEAGCGDDA